MLSFCQQEGRGAVPWSPLARGVPAYPRDEDELVHDDETGLPRPYRDTEGNIEINERVEELGELEIPQPSMSDLLRRAENHSSRRPSVRGVE